MNFISINDAKEKLGHLFEKSGKLKKEAAKGLFKEHLKNKSLAMIFKKASTRTRVSFEVAMEQLGGHAIYLDWTSTQLERGETLEDTARALSRYVSGIMIRSKHSDIVELGKSSSVPVINGLSDLEHPCQVLADLFTIKEFKGRFRGTKLAYVGDGNNVCNSLMLGSSLVGMDISAACPRGYEPNAEILRIALKNSKKTGSKIEVLGDPQKAVKNADVIYTDVWVSMGLEHEKERRMRDFAKYQVNSALVKKSSNALIMHCLPARRGLEITSEVLESKRSIVFEQAENRLHAQKALLCMLLGEK